MQIRANTWFLLILTIFCASCADEIVDTGQPSPQPPHALEHAQAFRILILGDSLTEGYGVSPGDAYPHLLEEKLNANRQPGTPFFEVINGGVTGSTTSGGLSRIEWHLKSPPHLLIVALGGNDGLRGIPPSETQKNLGKIIQRAQQKNVSVLLAGMKLPPNYGPQYTKKFQNIFPQLADEHGLPLLPFLLQGVGGNPHMNLPDRIHPNAAGHQLICETVYQFLLPNLPNFSK